MKSPGFHFRLLATAFVLIGGAVFVMGYLGFGMTQRYVLARFEERNEFLAGYLARNAELGILIGDEQMLSRLGMGLLSESDVAGVEIFDSQGKELVSLFEGQLYDYVVVYSSVMLRAVGEEPFHSRDFAGIEQPGDIIGQIAIYFSLHEINDIQASLVRNFAVLSFGVALLSIFVFYIISRSLVNPVNKLAHVAGRIASGSRKVRARPDTIPETRELALAFNSMLDSLDESNKQLEKLYRDMARQKTLAELGKFAMLIAHEVKNPLSIIKSSLDVLKDEAGLTSNDPMVHYIEDEIRRISRLLEDFLAFSRPSRPDLRDIDLNQLVSECVDRLQVQYDRDTLELVTSIESKEYVSQADKDLMAKALHNLLKNAIEANEHSGKILVRSWHQDKWIMEVEDQGPGIALSMEDKIFEPFFTTKNKGSGLGLAFVSYVIDAHGGVVRGYNKESGGAVFRVEL
ncbi:sensor histidine kinase [Desulfonatronovibrio magnus]|uniref:sensor histidine kinase n=1 Tax=Desulfonatronovibrio magnus TaxID=698827 RepID=UPI0005EB548E|nr:sensor histidine kinase [Desulfonatronovibrio magnus]